MGCIFCFWLALVDSVVVVLCSAGIMGSHSILFAQFTTTAMIVLNWRDWFVRYRMTQHRHHHQLSSRTIYHLVSDIFAWMDGFFQCYIYDDRSMLEQHLIINSGLHWHCSSRFRFAKSTPSRPTGNWWVCLLLSWHSNHHSLLIFPMLFHFADSRKEALRSWFGVLPKSRPNSSCLIDNHVSSFVE